MRSNCCSPCPLSMALQYVRHTTRVQHLSSSMQALLPGMRSCSCSSRGPGAHLRQPFKVFCSPERKVGCADLYNMTEVIKAQRQPTQTPQSTAVPASSDAAQPPDHPLAPGTAGEQPGTSADTTRGVRYYAGLLTTGLQVDNQASASDMLKRSLQLAGGVAGFLALLTYLFLASNNLL